MVKPPVFSTGGGGLNCWSGGEGGGRGGHNVQGFQGGHAQVKVKFPVFPAFSLCLQFFPCVLSKIINTF